MVAGFFKKIKLNPQKLYLREIFACLLLIIGIYFLRKQRQEVQAIIPYLKNSNPVWLLVSLAVSVLYLFFQTGMYVNSFKAVDAKISWIHALELFLKRYLLSVFLPGGGVTALTYTPINVKNSIQEGVKIHQASGVFAFGGILTTFLIGLPLIFTNVGKANGNKALTGLVIIATLIVLLYSLFRGIRKKGTFYNALNRRFPKVAKKIFEFADTSITFKRMAVVVGFSVGVELCGIIHLYLAMLAIGVHPNFLAAGLSYVITLLLMAASPFLKGLGAVELSIIYVLGQFGYTPVQALAIGMIFRIFEFWLPIVCGVIAFLLKGKELFLRIFPAICIFALGIINMLSVIGSPIRERLQLLRTLVPSGTIDATNTLIVFVGLILIVIAGFLIKGWRNAWWLGLVISFISIGMHLINGLHYIEAIIAAIVFMILLFTRNHYPDKGDPKHVNTGLSVALVSFIAILVYGFIGFYFLDRRQFGQDFSWQDSTIYSVKSLLLLKSNDLSPLTRFAREFLRSLYVLGVFAWSFLVYSIFRPYVKLPHKSQGAGSINKQP